MKFLPLLLILCFLTVLSGKEINHNDLEKVYAKLTAQWYVDPNDPEWGWNVERPGYVLREREVFLDGVCSVIKERDGDEWLIWPRV